MSLNDTWKQFLENSNIFTPAKNEDVVFSSASRTSSINSSGFDSKGFKGVRFFLDITAVTGTSPTLDIKIQVYDSLTASYQDLPGAAFAQKTTTGSDLLTVYPGIAETANESVSDTIGSQYRAVATIGGSSPDFTFSLNADYLK